MCRFRYCIAFCYICFASVTKPVNAKNVEVDIESELPGIYEYIDVNGQLNISSDVSRLQNIICPQTMAVSKGMKPNNFNLQIGNASIVSDGITCYVETGESVSVTLHRGVVATIPAGPVSELATLDELRDHFPLFYGNFSDHNMICPSLSTSRSTTTIATHDIGYIYSLVNHYDASGLTLGDHFNVLNRSSFEAIIGSHSISMTVDPTEGFELGCEYMRPKDKQELEDRVNALLDPSPQPRPIGSGTPSPLAQPRETKKGKCLPGMARVIVEDEGFVEMSDLRVGQSVLDAGGHYSKVILFTHGDGEVESEFVQIETTSGSVVLSPSHYIYANDSMVAAEHVEVGDAVTLMKGRKWDIEEKERVERIERVVLNGLYNPQTISGTVVVFWSGDGVLVSTYTSAIDARIAHLVLSPLRFLGQTMGLTIPIVSKLFIRGNEFWPQLIRNVHHFSRTWSSSSLS